MKKIFTLILIFSSVALLCINSSTKMFSQNIDAKIDNSKLDTESDINKHKLLIVQAVNEDTLESQIQVQTQKLQQIEKNGEGREFWLCFMTNFEVSASIRHTNIDLQLFITGDYDTKVTIEFAKIGYKETISLKAGEVMSVKMDKLAENTEFGRVDYEQAIHITSIEPISVYGLNRRSMTTDTFLGYPVEVLGTDYMVMAYNAFHDRLLSLFAVVATEDNTEVTIIPSTQTIDGKPKGRPFIITMNKGDVYQSGGRVFMQDRRYADVTGTIIKSNKKIAVFGGHQCATIPTAGILACNHLVEQLPPVPTWGKHFYLGTLKLRSRYTFRVLAAHDSTRIFQDTSLIAILNKGDFIERESKNNIQITADKPILVAQYSQSLKAGGGDGDGVGDPMMILVSPTQQFLKKYRFATPVNGMWHHFINVMVPTNAINSLRVNGAAIDKNNFEQMGVSKFSLASIRLPYGSHTVECSQPFGLYSYGFGSGGDDLYDAYGTTGGQSFVDYIPTIDSVPPAAELMTSSKKKSILLSDDESDDTGLSEVEIVSADNIKAKIPKFVKSAPSLFVDFDVENLSEGGRVVIRAQDVAMNEIFYTICYVFDNTSSEYVFKLNKGNVGCSSTKSIQLGLFYSHSYNFYDADFNSTAGIASTTNFDGLTGRSGIFGVSLSRNIFGKIAASAKLILQTNRADFTSIDTTKKFVKDSITGNYTSYFEGKDIKIKNTSLNFDLGVDYKISSYFYLSGGLALSWNINKKADCEESIYFPPGFAYEDNSVTRSLASELSSLNSLDLGVYIGPGMICNIGRGFSIFADLNYYYYPFSLLKDGDLFSKQLNLKFGIKYSI